MFVIDDFVLGSEEALTNSCIGRGKAVAFYAKAPSSPGL